MLVILGRAITVAVAGMLASLITQKLIAKIVTLNRHTKRTMNQYHSEIEDPFEEQLVINLIPTGKERALIAEMCDVFEGQLWTEGSQSGILDQSKLEEVESMRLKWKFPKKMPLDLTETID
tara:strand:+ start:246 stop:608 length:363 start_codon:yes stop_codon:yes gene_type:complete